MSEPETILWRQVGPKELELIEQTKMRAFPPRFPEQLIFYPVLSEEYAVNIARNRVDEQTVSSRHTLARASSWELTHD